LTGFASGHSRAKLASIGATEWRSAWISAMRMGCRLKRS
jgi:hypothetical protein